MSYGNEPTKQPDLKSVGHAWRVSAPDAEENASVGSDWLVHAPYSHPFWWWYLVSVVHLRPLPGKGEAKIQFPGASHELLVLALNPEEPLPDVDRWGSPDSPPLRYLTPPDHSVQFIVASDEQACEIGDLVARTIVDGMSADQDYRGWWREAIANAAEHVRLGGHPDS